MKLISDCENIVFFASAIFVLAIITQFLPAAEFAGKNIVSEVSMVEAVKLAAEYGPNYNR